MVNPSAVFVWGHKTLSAGAGEGGFGALARDARRILLTGELFSARRAEVIGLINDALSGDQLMPAALHIARK